MNHQFSHNRLVLSKEWVDRAELCDAWASTRHNIISQDIFPEDVYPMYASRAQGAYFWDVDGNRYIDFILGFGTVILGHADARVTDAVVRELTTGVNISPFWRTAQVELAESLTSIIPGAEMACLMKTGSDATSGALRLARIFTNRDKVIRWGYNGWHDWSCHRTAGVPESVLSETLTFRYNDIDSLEALFKKYPKEIACVLMMPFELEHPSHDFLEKIRQMAHEHGALFILDEMRSGFRMALGGAQEYFGVQADLATFSKAMSNGYAISAITGRADVLQGISQTHMSSTFFKNSAEMVAAITTIDLLKNSDALSHIWKMGEKFINGLNALINEFEIQATVEGYPPCPFLKFNSQDVALRQDEMKKFYFETTRQGVLFHPNHHWFVSAAHTEEDINHTLEVCRTAFKAI